MWYVKRYGAGLQVRVCDISEHAFCQRCSLNICWPVVRVLFYYSFSLVSILIGVAILSNCYITDNTVRWKVKKLTDILYIYAHIYICIYIFEIVTINIRPARLRLDHHNASWKWSATTLYSCNFNCNNNNNKILLLIYLQLN